MITLNSILLNYILTCTFQLSSIPEVSGTQADPIEKTKAETKVDINPPPEVSSPENSELKGPLNEQSSDSVQPKDSPVPSHPEYDRFIKMVSVGVPLEAVKLKLSAEGLDPYVFAKLVQNRDKIYT